MNILLVDINENIKDTLESIILCMKPNWKVFYVNDINYGLDQYKTNNIQMLIIDFSEEKNQKLLNDILDINPQIKTITISEQLSCSKSKGCEFCIENYNSQRLLKPIEAKELYETIENFDTSQCKYAEFKSFSKIKELLPVITKRFNSLQYNHEKNTIYVDTTMPSSYHISDIIKITSILDNFDIRYECSDDSTIKIL